jgi:ABC-type branched-subunit amino acid transport system permease subunit
VLLVPIQQILTLQFGANNLDQILYGMLFLLILLGLPDGVIPSIQRWGKR